jgi:hypothetical protein
LNWHGKIVRHSGESRNLYANDILPHKTFFLFNSARDSGFRRNDKFGGEGQSANSNRGELLE